MKLSLKTIIPQGTSFNQDERGLSTVEYLILLVLIAVAGISLWGAFGDAIEKNLSGATTAVEGLSGDGQ